ALPRLPAQHDHLEQGVAVDQIARVALVVVGGEAVERRGLDHAVAQELDQELLGDELRAQLAQLLHEITGGDDLLIHDRLLGMARASLSRRDRWRTTGEIAGTAAVRASGASRRRPAGRAWSPG